MGWQGLQLVLFIDGNPFDFSQAELLYQSAPYPGDHRYVIRIRGPGALRTFTGFKPGRYGPMDRATTERVFATVWWLKEHLGKGLRRVEFWLNSVDEVDAGADEVVISGVCSSVLGRPGAVGGSDTS